MKFSQIILIFTIFAANSLASAALRERRQAVKECLGICTAEYEPVCGSNTHCLRAFSNDCQLEVYNCDAEPGDRYVQVDASRCNHFEEPNFWRC